MEYFETIAKILRVDKDVVKGVESHLGTLTGKHGVMDAIGQENEKYIQERLALCNLKFDASSKEIYEALIQKINKDDRVLHEAMGAPVCSSHTGCMIIRQFLYQFFPKRTGLFLKKERFIELLESEPPKKIMTALGYSSVATMMEQEDWREVAAALRFFEGNKWINTYLLPHYKTLTPDHFEEREMEIIALDPKWKELAQSFVEKKYHNISHLKELGIIFIIPISLGIPGELIRTVALLAHYMNEVRFYSDLFIAAAKRSDNFSTGIISLLRGDIIDDRSLLGDNDWMVVQRYLAKDDEYDWRLFTPHVNPEAMHWERAEHMISQMGQHFNIPDLAFWENLNWVGNYFSTSTGIDVLVSFNLIDTSMSLVKEKEMIKYLYHHQEALWNKIFTAYFGERVMEQSIQDNVLGGIIRL